MNPPPSESRSASFPDPTLLDEQVVEQLRDLGALEDIGRAYLEDLPQQLKALREAVNRHDLARVGWVAHSLKGASASSGAKGVAEACAQVEKMARSGTLAGVDDLLTNIEGGVTGLAIAFEKAWA